MDPVIKVSGSSRRPVITITSDPCGMQVAHIEGNGDPELQQEVVSSHMGEDIVSVVMIRLQGAHENLDDLRKYRRDLHFFSHDVRGNAYNLRIGLELLRELLTSYSTLEPGERKKLNEELSIFWDGVYNFFSIKDEDGIGKLEEWVYLADNEVDNSKDTLERCRNHGELVQADFVALAETFIPLAEKLRKVPIDSSSPRACGISIVSRCEGVQRSLQRTIECLEYFNKYVAYGDYNGPSKILVPSELVERIVHFPFNLRNAIDITIQVIPQNNFIGYIQMSDVAFSRCLENLLSNAAKACKRVKREGYEPKCEISLERENGKVRILVDDNGPGVPTHMREGIFKEGVSLTLGESKGNGDGVNQGLGLASVSRLIEAAGGKVWVEDSLTLGGARFVMELPAVDPKTLGEPFEYEVVKVTTAPITGRKSPSAFLPIKIYLIDDNPDSRETLGLLISVLFNSSCQVTTAKCVEDVLPRIQEDPPHIVFVDGDLGNRKMRGPELLKKLEELNIKGVRVIVLTGDSKIREEFPFLTNEDVMIKPADPQEIKRVIDEGISKLQKE